MKSENPLTVFASSLLVLAILFLVLLALSGCATVEPDAVRVFAEHRSHALQHEPFTSHPTKYGTQSVAVEAHWQKGPAFLDVSEGYMFNGDQMCNWQVCGGRETFTARVGYELRLK